MHILPVKTHLTDITIYQIWFLLILYRHVLKICKLNGCSAPSPELRGKGILILLDEEVVHHRWPRQIPNLLDALFDTIELAATLWFMGSPQSQEEPCKPSTYCSMHLPPCCSSRERESWLNQWEATILQPDLLIGWKTAVLQKSKPHSLKC